MNRAVGFIVAAALAAACGDNFGPSGMTGQQLLGKLRALPGVTADQVHTDLPGVSYYVLHFTQLIDHDDPGQGTFQQEVSLLHRDELAPTPMIIQTSGYWDYYRDKTVELTDILGANQVSIEHRFFGGSRPASADWSKLTIKQAATDEHEIIAALRTIYDGAFLTTGASKGGMTAIFHRRYFPDDVEGTVAYVAPLTFGAPDPRYPQFFDTVGPAACRNAVRAIAIEMLANRRAQLEERAGAQLEFAYSRISLGPAVESAITGLEWSFWQYFGVDHCGDVPEVTASDNDVFAFLDSISPVHECADSELANMEAYYYQSYTELGYPDYRVPYLEPYRKYTDAEYRGELPVTEPATEPTYDPTAMFGILDFVDRSGDRLLFVYGEWDPWIKGRVVLGQAADSQSYIVPEGTHAAEIRQLKSGECDTAAAMLERWTGVTPQLGWWRRAGAATTHLQPPVQLPQMSPVLLHALGAGR